MLEESIRAYMAARGSVFEARVFDCVDSTNTVLAALARSGAPEFTAVIAGAQTAGRGRGEHRFFSPAGCGVYFSLLLRPRFPAVTAAKLITPACAVAAARAIERASGEAAGIKWVNDVFLRGRKVCGILTESGTVDAPIGRQDGSVIRRCVRADGKPAVTHFVPLRHSDRYTLLSLRLETGRTHQIRVHMAHLGYPLAGDDLYGGDTRDFSHHMLHCDSLEFLDPVTGELRQYAAECPWELQ